MRADFDITVIIPLYNKERYVAEAIESVLMQETAYKYKIIIADDCSTDGSLKIVEDYAYRYPNIFTILYSSKNQKLFRNVVRAYSMVDTPYFCVLGPDDFWIDNKKIQKALDFLETNKEYSIYVTNTIVQSKDGTKSKYLSKDKVVDSSFEQFVGNSATVGNALGSVLRNVVFCNGLPDKLKRPLRSDQEESFRGDTFITAIHLNKGRAHYVPDCDAVYRITDEGLWQGMSVIRQKIFQASIYVNLCEYFDWKHIGFINTAENLISDIDKNWAKYIESAIMADDLSEVLKNYKFITKRISDFRSGIYFDSGDKKERRKKRKNVWLNLNYRLWKHLTKKLKKAELIN